MQIEMDFVTTSKTNDPLDLTKLTTNELRPLCFIPEGGIPEGPEKKARIQQWFKANEEARRRNAQAEIQEFQARGTAQTWFSRWRPKSTALQSMQESLEEAIHVVETLYPPIFARGLKHQEDMGLLQMDRRGQSEGIRIKRETYGELILVQICCVTGPTNFDPQEGTIEFEPGSKSHIFMLAYQNLPTLKDLEADVCTLPLIRHPSNVLISPSGKKFTYRSEGFTSSKLANQGLALHQSWNTLSPAQQTKLQTIWED